jgi:hypothetical protein
MASNNHRWNGRSGSEVREVFNQNDEKQNAEYITPDAKIEALRNVEKLIEQTRRELEGD